MTLQNIRINHFDIFLTLTKFKIDNNLSKP